MPAERYWHRFRKEDGSVIEVEATQKGYRDLALKDPTNPTHPDGVWFQSESGYRLDPLTYAEEKAEEERVMATTEAQILPKKVSTNGNIPGPVNIPDTNFPA